MNIPQVDNLSTQRLSRIFDKTVATYKYYWFISILDLYIRRGKKKQNIWDIMVEMVVNAWYPVCYFHLSFGNSESLYDAIHQIQREYAIPINIKSDDLRAWLNEHRADRNVYSILSFLPKNVPFRFLRPWIDTSDDRATVERSQTFENGCLYRLLRESGTMWVELNEEWLHYVEANYPILRDFAYWNLTLFLQVRNPNVPNIPNKLIKSETRNSLARQHQLWNLVINYGCPVKCIYTEKELSIGHYDLDHFIPWSFVSHDLVWNLLPADSSINSSKSDKLPQLDIYLPRLAHAQQQALQVVLAHDFNGQILEDYLSLGATPQEIAGMDEDHLIDCFSKTYTPMNQIALNMGFETWRY